MPHISDDHSEEFEELAGLSALDALEGDDLARFVEHRAHCVRCQHVEQLDRDVLGQLPWVVPEIEPSPEFKAALLERAKREMATSARRRRHLARLAGLFALAGVALVTVVISVYAYQPVATYALEGCGSGSATLSIRRSGNGELVLHGLPEPGPGFVYAAWIIHQPGAVPQLAGVSTTGSSTIQLEGDVRSATVAITRERGSPDIPTPPFVRLIQLTR